MDRARHVRKALGPEVLGQVLLAVHHPVGGNGVGLDDEETRHWGPTAPWWCDVVTAYPNHRHELLVFLGAHPEVVEHAEGVLALAGSGAYSRRMKLGLLVQLAYDAGWRLDGRVTGVISSAYHVAAG